MPSQADLADAFPKDVYGSLSQDALDAMIFAMRPAIQSYIEAAESFSKEFREIIAPGIQERVNAAFRIISESSSILDFRLIVTERAARRYAKLYNSSHAGRRISWRRLNRVQAREAFRKFQQ